MYFITEKEQRFLQIPNGFYNGFYNGSYSSYTVSTSLVIRMKVSMEIQNGFYKFPMCFNDHPVAKLRYGFSLPPPPFYAKLNLKT